MPLSPEMEFHYDPSWPTAGEAVFMTPTRVWGPLTTAFYMVLNFIKGGVI